MASRKLEDLHPITQKKAKLFLAKASEAGIDVLIYCTYRPPDEQEVLYMQGRLEQYGITEKDLNYHRRLCRLYPLSDKDANRIVTNAKPWQSFHQYGLAFDCVPMHGGKPAWEDTEAYERLGEIGKKVGLEWAGDWKSFKETPHFQDTEMYEHIIHRE